MTTLKKRIAAFTALLMATAVAVQFAAACAPNTQQASDEYAVTTDYNNEVTGAASLPRTYYVKHGEALSSVDEPQVQGYDFEGWTYSADGGGEVSFPLTPSRDMAIYAQWSVQMLNVTFDFTEADANPVVAEVEYGSTVTPLSEEQIPEYPGYKFREWRLENGNPVNFASPIRSNVTYYAAWLSDDTAIWSVNFDANYPGAEAIPSQTVVAGEVGGCWQQVVGIKRRIEIGVEFEERFQMILGIGLPFGIAEQVALHLGMLAYGQCQVWQEFDERKVAARCRDEDILIAGSHGSTERCFFGIVCQGNHRNGTAAQFFFQAFDEVCLFLGSFFGFDEDDIGAAESTQEVVVDLRIKIGLRRIDLVDAGIAENRIVFRRERDDQSDVFLLGKFGQWLDMLLVKRAEDDIYVLHLAAGKDALQRSVFRTGVVGIKVERYTLALQAVDGHQQSFVVFEHTGRLAFLNAFGQ